MPNWESERQVMSEALRCPALANVAWSEMLSRLPIVVAFQVSVEVPRT